MNNPPEQKLSERLSTLLEKFFVMRYEVDLDMVRLRKEKGEPEKELRDAILSEFTTLVEEARPPKSGYLGTDMYVRGSSEGRNAAIDEFEDNLMKGLGG